MYINSRLYVTILPTRYLLTGCATVRSAIKINTTLLGSDATWAAASMQLDMTFFFNTPHHIYGIIFH